MDAAFKKYLQDFLERYGIESNNINFDQIHDYQTMLGQLTAYNIDPSTIRNHLKVIFYLYKKGVYLYETQLDDYKSSKKYLEIKDEWISCSDGNLISIENYIEYFLIDKDSLTALYAQESIYAMGNPYELDDNECKLAKVIMTEDLIPVDNKAKKPDPEDLVLADSTQISRKMEDVDPNLIKRLCREDAQQSYKHKKAGGLVIRLHRDLRFSIAAFPLKKEYKAEICKIIYFFMVLEHSAIIPTIQGKKMNSKEGKKNEQYFNSTDFLSRPSMENPGEKFSRDKRLNGKITDFIKNELEKEINLKESSIVEIENVRIGFKSIVDAWIKLFSSIREAINTDQEIDFDQMIHMCNSIDPPFLPYSEIVNLYSFKNPPPESCIPTNKNLYTASPIIELYFKILQFEYLGEIEDRRELNEIEIDSDYNVPKDFIEKMKIYKNQFVERTNIEKHIRKHINRIAECVYTKSSIEPKEIKKLNYCIENVHSVLNYCIYAGRIIKPENEISELHIISCLQAMILDEDDPENEYVFYDYQHHLKSPHKPKIYCKPSDGKKPLLAVQKLYWAQKVEAHWYANLGKFELYCKSRRFEEYLYRILKRLCLTDNIEEMKQYSEERYDKLTPFFKKSVSEDQTIL